MHGLVQGFRAWQREGVVAFWLSQLAHRLPGHQETAQKPQTFDLKNKISKLMLNFL